MLLKDEVVGKLDMKKDTFHIDTEAIDKLDVGFLGQQVQDAFNSLGK